MDTYGWLLFITISQSVIKMEPRLRILVQVSLINLHCLHPTQIDKNLQWQSSDVESTRGAQMQLETDLDL